MALSLSLPSGLRALLLSKAHLITAGGWVAGMFIVLQAMRLGTSIGLAHLLSPALLGTMALINTLRTGGELLSDIGVGQSIVNHKDGDQPYFYQTAWTLQIMRGFALFGLALVAIIPLTEIYDDPALKVLLPVSAVVFIISGFVSPARFLLQKRIAAKRIALFSLAGASFSAALHLGLAWYLQSIWALVLGLLISAVFDAALTWFMIDWRIHRLRFDKGAVRAIFGFGKWVFLSTLIYFLAGNFDRLYLAEAVSFAALGVYGIARTFADTAMNLTQHVSSQVLFPKVSGSPLRGRELRQAILPARRVVVWLIAAGMGFGITFADEFIELVYDDRYHDAAFYLPVLLAGGWFGMLSAFSESILMGIGKPSNVAMGNAAKLAVIVLLVPVVLPRYGMGAAVMIFAGVEFVRYALLAMRQRAHGLSFWRQDMAATAAFIILALILRELTGIVGLTSGVEGWIAITRQALGI